MWLAIKCRYDVSMLCKSQQWKSQLPGVLLIITIAMGNGQLRKWQGCASNIKMLTIAS